MPRWILLGRILVALLPFSLFALPCVHAQDRDQVKRGRELFFHHWRTDDQRSAEGDGLGPMSNANSCGTCHREAGAGNNDFNVQLLTVVLPPERARVDQVELRDRLSEVHPAFVRGFGISPTIVLHRFGTSQQYELWRLRLLGLEPGRDYPDRRKESFRRAAQRKWDRSGPVVKLPEHNGLTLLLSERNTPSLYGSAQLDSIPDEAIRQLAEQQARRRDGISGRVAPLDGDGVGRFGWRGQVGSLREFVAAACAVEVGLQVDDHNQAIDPTNPGQKAGGNDLTGSEFDELLAFIEQLPAPEQERPEGQAGVMAGLGETLFHNIHCVACHVPDVGEVQGLYSDLLLHDLGNELADPSPAQPDRVAVGVQRSAGPYGGSTPMFADVPGEIQREWRTPPLWGVADSPPYLHDGRAADLEQAILMHGGEANEAVRRYKMLPDVSRQAVIAFLLTLRTQGDPFPSGCSCCNFARSLTVAVRLPVSPAP